MIKESTSPKTELSGKIQTVLGTINPEDLGITHPHEHLIIDGSCWFEEASEGTQKAMLHHPVTMDILWWIRYHPLENLDDCLLLDEELAIKEVMYYRLAGGNSLIDMTNEGIGRDPIALTHISRATGLNIIMGAGHYVSLSETTKSKAKSEDELTDDIVRDITIGVGTTKIRSGIIGEIGCQWPLQDIERRNLRAAARASKITGASINVHPGFSEAAPLEICDILQEAGADLSRVVISHLDRTLLSQKTRLEFAKKGCYLEYDEFGFEGFYPTQFRGAIDFPTDVGRINWIMDLIDHGYINQILISQDTCFKHHLRSYGGWGYDHILRDVVPVMYLKGMTEEQINIIMVDNPKRLLTIL
jgi:phosphotriesterase-related protein